jgi:hypothetical protein
MRAKLISDSSLWSMAAILITLLVSGCMPAHAADKPFAGDITCSGSERFFIPGACTEKCSQQKHTLARITGGMCGFSSSCPAYGHETKSALPVFYNQALFGRGAVKGEQAQLVLASHIINTYYPPNNVKLITVLIGSAEGGDDFAHTEPGKPGKNPTLTIQSDLFFTAPGYLISTIGHEMVHVEQQKRTYKTNLTGINSLVGAMRELEASSWELGADNFPRSFGASKISSCMRDSEKQGDQMAYACRAWQVKQSIEDVRTGPKSSTYLPAVEKWLNEDPWASKVWLPGNPNWRTQNAGAMPPKCTKP